MWPSDSLPQRGNTNWKTFYASNSDWQTYSKPSGATMIYVFIQASGGGGSRVSDGIVSIGGGGGGAGGVTKLLIPAALLPDTIYVLPGKGGLGATTANTLGVAGGISYLSLEPTTNAADLIIRQDGGRPGTTVGAAGQLGTTASNTQSTFSFLGLRFSFTGQAGTGGSASTNGSVNIITTGNQNPLTTGGTGGGNGTAKGGNISAGGLFPSLTQPTGTGLNGLDGVRKGLIIGPGDKTNPMFFSGGCGGNGVTTAITAGKGGDASYGGGGGGGGSGTNAGSISGDGGNGGDGFIIIGTL